MQEFVNNEIFDLGNQVLMIAYMTQEGLNIIKLGTEEFGKAEGEVDILKS